MSFCLERGEQIREKSESNLNFKDCLTFQYNGRSTNARETYRRIFREEGFQTKGIYLSDINGF